MPQGHDVVGDTANTTSEYECLHCGHIVGRVTHPGTCPRCGGGFQDRAKSLE